LIISNTRTLGDDSINYCAKKSSRTESEYKTLKTEENRSHITKTQQEQTLEQEFADRRCIVKYGMEIVR